VGAAVRLGFLERTLNLCSALTIQAREERSREGEDFSTPATPIATSTALNLEFPDFAFKKFQDAMLGDEHV
jgi:hypothetical protein